MPEPEPSVADFYAPVMAGWPVEVQRLVVQLLSREFGQASDVEDAILAVATRAEEEGGSS